MDSLFAPTLFNKMIKIKIWQKWPIFKIKWKYKQINNSSNKLTVRNNNK